MKRPVFCLMHPWIFALALPFSAAAQQSPTATPSPANLEAPFQLHNGFLIVVEGRIGTISGLRFILDTGSTRSILDTKTADNLRIKVSPHPNHVVNFDKTVRMESTTLQEVQFGPVRATKVKMFIADLSTFSDFAFGIDALIGLDLLELNNLTFDYNTRRVLFSPIDHNINIAQIKSQPTCFTVKAQVQGYPVRLILDTGLDGVLFYEDSIRAHVPGLRMEPGVENVTIGRQMRAKRATLPEMRIGPTVMDGRVQLIKGRPGKLIEGIDGYIGIAPFNARRITLNFTSRTISWE